MRMAGVIAQQGHYGCSDQAMESGSDRRWSPSWKRSGRNALPQFNRQTPRGEKLDARLWSGSQIVPDAESALHGIGPRNGPDEHRCGGILRAEGNRAVSGRIWRPHDLFEPRRPLGTRSTRFRRRPVPRTCQDFWQRWNGKACCVWSDLIRAARLPGGKWRLLWEALIALGIARRR